MINNPVRAKRHMVGMKSINHGKDLNHTRTSTNSSAKSHCNKKNMKHPPEKMCVYIYISVNTKPILVIPMLIPIKENDENA